MRQKIRLGIIFPNNSYKVKISEVYQDNNGLIVISHIDKINEIPADRVTIRGAIVGVHPTANKELPVKHYVVSPFGDTFSSDSKQVTYTTVANKEAIDELKKENKENLKQLTWDSIRSPLFMFESRVIPSPRDKTLTSIISKAFAS